MTPREFIAKWKRVALNERQTAQTHFLDLCRALDHPDPISDDPLGEHFCFEKGVTKTGDGFADVWKQGFFAWEYKKKKRNLDAAHGVAQRQVKSLTLSSLHALAGHRNYSAAGRR